jgi:hypothetical protein
VKGDCSGGAPLSLQGHCGAAYATLVPGALLSWRVQYCSAGDASVFPGTLQWYGHHYGAWDNVVAGRPLSFQGHRNA